MLIVQSFCFTVCRKTYTSLVYGSHLAKDNESHHIKTQTIRRGRSSRFVPLSVFVCILCLGAIIQETPKSQTVKNEGGVQLSAVPEPSADMCRACSKSSRRTWTPQWPMFQCTDGGRKIRGCSHVNYIDPPLSALMIPANTLYLEERRTYDGSKQNVLCLCHVTVVYFWVHLVAKVFQYREEHSNTIQHADRETWNIEEFFEASIWKFYWIVYFPQYPNYQLQVTDYWLKTNLFFTLVGCRSCSEYKSHTKSYMGWNFTILLNLNPYYHQRPFTVCIFELFQGPISKQFGSSSVLRVQVNTS